uniref:SPK domain-containing protein n=1 Tax=Caenorhabditis tropicalis TaxID=1561998 RepID=A0A1I7TKR4_9PELO
MKQRVSFTTSEDMRMLRWVARNECDGGITKWRNYLKAFNCNHTIQSLSCRMRRNIVPNLESYIEHMNQLDASRVFRIFQPRLNERQQKIIKNQISLKTNEHVTLLEAGSNFKRLSLQGKPQDDCEMKEKTVQNRNPVFNSMRESSKMDKQYSIEPYCSVSTILCQPVLQYSIMQHLQKSKICFENRIQILDIYSIAEQKFWQC